MQFGQKTCTGSCARAKNERTLVFFHILCITVRNNNIIRALSSFSTHIRKEIVEGSKRFKKIKSNRKGLIAQNKDYVKKQSFFAHTY